MYKHNISILLPGRCPCEIWSVHSHFWSSRVGSALDCPINLTISACFSIVFELDIATLLSGGCSGDICFNCSLGSARACPSGLPCCSFVSSQMWWSSELARSQLTSSLGSLNTLVGCSKTFLLLKYSISFSVVTFPLHSVTDGVEKRSQSLFSSSSWTITLYSGHVILKGGFAAHGMKGMRSLETQVAEKMVLLWCCELISTR